MYFKIKLNNFKKVLIGADFITAFRTFLTFKLRYKAEKVIKKYIDVKACSQAPRRFFLFAFYIVLFVRLHFVRVFFFL